MEKNQTVYIILLIQPNQNTFMDKKNLFAKQTVTLYTHWNAIWIYKDAKQIHKNILKISCYPLITWNCSHLSNTILIAEE